MDGKEVKMDFILHRPFYILRLSVNIVIGRNLFFPHHVGFEWRLDLSALQPLPVDGFEEGVGADWAERRVLHTQSYQGVTLKQLKQEKSV